nr:hypothetical protein [Mycoplasmopsis bovis]
MTSAYLSFTTTLRFCESSSICEGNSSLSGIFLPEEPNCNVTNDL